MKLGSKSGLFRSRIGLNVTVHNGLFHYGKIRIECVGEIEDGVIQGMSEGSRHQIETIRLPEALKRERTQVFMGKEVDQVYTYTNAPARQKKGSQVFLHDHARELGRGFTKVQQVD